MYEYRCLVHRYYFVEANKWAHTRNVVYTLFCINTTEKNKPSISEFMPLLIDNFTPIKDQEMTEERKAELMEIANARLRALQANKILK